MWTRRWSLHGVASGGRTAGLDCVEVLQLTEGRYIGPGAPESNSESVKGATVVWLVQILEIIVRRRRFVLINVFVVSVFAIVVSLLLPKHYKSSATILPPDNERSLSGLMGLSMGHIAEAVSSFSLPIMATPSDLYASIIQSDTIVLGVVDQLHLQQEYDSETRFQAAVELRDHFTVKVEPEGIIRLDVDARRPELCAEIANSIVDHLDVFNRDLQQAKGRAYSEFLNRRLGETDSALHVAAERLKEFQITYHAVSLDVQAEALIKTLAEQKGRLTSNEIELEIMKRSLSVDHPAVLAKQREIFETRRRLLEIEGGADSRADSVISALDVPLTALPELGLRYAVLLRNLKIQEVTYELLSQQYEMYRLQAERDTPTISILDRARIPEKPFKPKKRMIVVTAFLFAFLLASAYVVFKEAPVIVAGHDNEIRLRIRSIWSDITHRPLG